VLNGLAPAAAWGDAPLLVVKAPGAHADAPTVFATPPDGAPLTSDTEAMRIDADPGTTGYVAPGASVIPLLKSHRNPFAEMVTVGRAGSNDVIIDDHHVSKMHCWFVKPAPGRRSPWQIRDNSATNGTFLNRTRLAANVPTPIKASDEIRFGTVDAIFIEASMLDALVDYARSTWTRLGIIRKHRSPDDTHRVEPPTPPPPPPAPYPDDDPQGLDD